VLAGAASVTDPRRCDYFKPDFFNGIAPKPTPNGGTADRLNRVESCPSPSLSEVALLSHSPCSPSER